MTFIYIILGIIVAASYVPAQNIMKAQTAWIWVKSSTVTLNFVILFFLYGVVCDRMTRGMARKKSWAIWAGGLALLILFLRFLGMSTIFG